jgi:hypothetical protein
VATRAPVVLFLLPDMVEKGFANCQMLFFMCSRHRTVDDPLHPYIKLEIECISNVSTHGLQY